MTYRGREALCVQREQGRGRQTDKQGGVKDEGGMGRGACPTGAVVTGPGKREAEDSVMEAGTGSGACTWEAGDHPSAG